MGKLDDDIAHWRLQIHFHQEELERYEDGTKEAFEMQGGQRVNVTADVMRKLMFNIAKLERNIAACEKKDA